MPQDIPHKKPSKSVYGNLVHNMIGQIFKHEHVYKLHDDLAYIETFDKKKKLLHIAPTSTQVFS